MIAAKLQRLLRRSSRLWESDEARCVTAETLIRRLLNACYGLG
jgi:hypothetical protein